MKHYGASDLQLEFNIDTQLHEVYLGNRLTGFSTERSETPGMYRVKYPDGVLSTDHYNLTRAKEHAIMEAAKYLHIGAEGGAGV